MQLNGKLIQNFCFMVDMFLLCQAVLERIIIIIKVKISLFAPKFSSAKRCKDTAFTKTQSYSNGEKILIIASRYQFSFR